MGLFDSKPEDIDSKPEDIDSKTEILDYKKQDPKNCILKYIKKLNYHIMFIVYF